jgi:hypothetical protein
MSEDANVQQMKLSTLHRDSIVYFLNFSCRYKRYLILSREDSGGTAAADPTRVAQEFEAGLLWRSAGGQRILEGCTMLRCSERRDDADKVRHSIYHAMVHATIASSEGMSCVVVLNERQLVTVDC